MHVPVAVGRPEVQVVGAAALLVHVAIELCITPSILTYVPALADWAERAPPLSTTSTASHPHANGGGGGGGEGGGGGAGARPGGWGGGGDGQPTATPPDCHPLSLLYLHDVPAASGHCASRLSTLVSPAAPVV